MHDCTSPNIVNFYGAFLHDSGDVIMCMEYMDCGYVYATVWETRSNVRIALLTEYQRTSGQSESMF